MISCLLGETSVQLASLLLLLRYVSHYCTLRVMCPAGHCCGSQVSLLARTGDCFHLLEAYMVSGTMKSSPQVGSIQVSSDSWASGTCV